MFFLLISLLGFGIKVMLTMQKELESVPSFASLQKNLCNINIICTLIVIFFKNSPMKISRPRISFGKIFNCELSFTDFSSLVKFSIQQVIWSNYMEQKNIKQLFQSLIILLCELLVGLFLFVHVPFSTAQVQTVTEQIHPVSLPSGVPRQKMFH